MKSRLFRIMLIVLPFALCFSFLFTCIAYADDTDTYTISVVAEQNDAPDGPVGSRELTEITDEDVPLASGEQMITDGNAHNIILAAVSIAALIICGIGIKVLIDRRNDKKFAEMLGVNNR